MYGRPKTRSLVTHFNRVGDGLWPMVIFRDCWNSSPLHFVFWLPIGHADYGFHIFDLNVLAVSTHIIQSQQLCSGLHDRGENDDEVTFHHT